MPEWNRAQLDAIEAKGGSIFVSAAAGSGKTAVLVERVIRKIISGEISADRFLIVTFTKAAAAELRQRIGEAIEDKINTAETEEKIRFLIRQRNLLPLARISTIDSFTQTLVRENSRLLGLPSRFEILEDKEIALYSDEKLNETMEKLYDKELQGDGSPLFELLELICDDKDDEKLVKAIKKLYGNADAYPFFDDYIDSVADAFDPNVSFEENIYVKYYAEQLLKVVNSCKIICESAIDMLSDVDKLAENKALFKNILNQFEEMEDGIVSGDYSKAFKCVCDFDWGNLQKEGVTSDVKPIAKQCTKKRDACKKCFSSIACIYSKEDLLSDFEYLHPIVMALTSATKKFHEKFLKFKIEHNRFTFNDILHFAVSLVADRGEKRGEYRPTELALSLRDSFDEILIDEYQDTNAAQDLLFSMISKDNLFCVGDVKQSIYRFRKAQPEIFIEKINSSSYFNRENPSFPAKIILDSNYRSRKCVTSAVNFIFEQIMSVEAGDVDYGKDEKLNPGFEYLPVDEAVELHIIDKKGGESDDDAVGAEKNAEYIAKLIKAKLDAHFLVEDKRTKTLRPCKPSDFMVLSRTVKEIGPLLVSALGREKIGGLVEAEGEFFESYEISLMLNLMRIIDNPKQDVPLLSVMMSPIFGFTADEVSLLRIEGEDRNADFYSLLHGKRESNEKIDSFLEKISYLRSLSYTMSTPLFIRELYDETRIELLSLLMTSPEKKRGNLSLLLHYADSYQAAGYIGLSGFIRYIDKLQQIGLDLEGSLDKAFGGNSVRILTIHKSKGLQAPIVILYDGAGGYNEKELSEDCIVSSSVGIGLKRKLRDENDIEFIKPTLAYEMVQKAEKRANRSEELRKFYVALTRAEERLIIIRAISRAKNKNGTPLKTLQELLPENCKKFIPQDILSQNEPFNTVMLPLLRHRDAGALRDLAGIENDYPRFGGDDFRLVIHVDETSEALKGDNPPEIDAEADDECLRIIDEAVNYTYKYLPLTHLVSKQAASEVDDLSVDNPYFAVSKPAFLMSGGFSAAQKGTITHSFMQYVDFEAVSFDGDMVHGVEEEIERLKRRAIISEEEAAVIDVRAVKIFFASPLAERMRKSTDLMREKKFTVHLPIDYYDKSLSQFIGEKITIQGIADAVFAEGDSLVIVDYKTDRIDSEDELIDRYWSQIKTYKEAMLQCTHYEKVSSMILYSFYMNKAIEIKD